MSSKFSHQRTPQPTPKVCLKGIIPPNPLPEPQVIIIALTYAPTEAGPPGPAAQTDFCLQKIPGLSVYTSPDIPSGINFVCTLYIDFPSYAAHLTVAVRSDATIYDFVNYYPFQTDGPPSWTEPDSVEAPGAASGTFRWLTYT